MWLQSSRHLWVSVAMVVALIGCEKSSPTEPGPVGTCTYSLSATSLSFGASGGPNSVNVTTASSCAWTASSDRGWMSITSGASGTGSGVVNISLTRNASSAVRTGTLTVAGQSVAVSQDGLAPCTIDISPSSASFGKDGATGTFSVSAAEHCQWTAVSNVAWLAVTAGQGTGNGSVSYSIERNRELTERTGTITVGNRTFTVTQAGDPPAAACEYSVTPIEFTPCMSVPFDMTATVTTQQGCSWTAEPDASWITVTGGHSKTGSGVITFRVSDNWDVPRQSVVKVRWPTETAGQNLQVRQAGCRYAVTANTITIAATGGPGRFDVIQSSDPNSCGGPLQNACIWTAEANVPWITVTTSMPQAGDNPVSFTVAPNSSGAARSGTIRVRDKVVTVAQAGS